MANIRPLVPELSAVAQNELNEVLELTPKAIKALKCWIEEEPYLKARNDDQFLVAFLRYCKYDLEKAKKRLDYFYTYKSTAGDLLKSSRIDDKILSISRAGILYTLPNPAGPGGPRIHLARMGKIDTSQFTVQDIFRFYAFRAEIETNADDNWVISGFLEVIDFSKIPFSLLRQFEPNLFRKMAAFLEFGIPSGLKGTHIVNASKEAQLILCLVRAVMKQKELLHIHSNLESLHQAIGKEYLPVEYGGINGTLEDAATNYEKQLLEYQDYFIENEEYGVDETLRNAEKHAASISCNTEGSFQRLNFD